MAKVDLGVKRECQGCDARFYDLGRDPVTCPKCGAVFKVETPRKSARAAKIAVAEVAIAPITAEEKAPIAGAMVDAEAPEAVMTAGEGDDDDAAEDLEADNSGANGLMEDTSELGEDADDLAEVVESGADDEEEDA